MTTKIKRFRSDRHRTDSILQQYALHAASSYFGTSLLHQFFIFREVNSHVVYLVIVLEFQFISYIDIFEQNSHQRILVKVISADFATSFAQLFILKSQKQNWYFFIEKSWMDGFSMGGKLRKWPGNFIGLI